MWRTKVPQLGRPLKGFGCLPVEVACSTALLFVHYHSCRSPQQLTGISGGMVAVRTVLQGQWFDELALMSSEFKTATSVSLKQTCVLTVCTNRIFA